MGGAPNLGPFIGATPSEAERLKRARKEAESVMAWEMWDAVLRGGAPPPRFFTWSQPASWEYWPPDTKERTEGHAPECECPKCEPEKWR